MVEFRYFNSTDSSVTDSNRNKSQDKKGIHIIVFFYFHGEIRKKYLLKKCLIWSYEHCELYYLRKGNNSVNKMQHNLTFTKMVEILNTTTMKYVYTKKIGFQGSHIAKQDKKTRAVSRQHSSPRIGVILECQGAL